MKLKLKLIFILLLGGIIIWLAVLLGKILWEERIIIAGGAIVLVAVLLIRKLLEALREAKRTKREAKRKSTVEQELRALLEKHLSTLALKKRQLTIIDAYGIEDNSK